MILGKRGSLFNTHAIFVLEISVCVQVDINYQDMHNVCTVNLNAAWTNLVSFSLFVSSKSFLLDIHHSLLDSLFCATLQQNEKDLNMCV